MTQVRRTLTNVERSALSKWRRKRGIYRCIICLTEAQLDALDCWLLPISYASSLAGFLATYYVMHKMLFGTSIL